MRFALVSLALLLLPAFAAQPAQATVLKCQIVGAVDAGALCYSDKFGEFCTLYYHDPVHGWWVCVMPYTPGDVIHTGVGLLP